MKRRTANNFEAVLVRLSSLCCWAAVRTHMKGYCCLPRKKKMVIPEDGELERIMVPSTVEASNHLCSDYYTREKIFLCSSDRRHQECEWLLRVEFLDCVLKRPPSLHCLCTTVTEIAAVLDLEMEAPPWGCQSHHSILGCVSLDSYVSKKQTCHVLGMKLGISRISWPQPLRFCVSDIFSVIVWWNLRSLIRRRLCVCLTERQYSAWNKIKNTFVPFSSSCLPNTWF